MKWFALLAVLALAGCSTPTPADETYDFTGFEAYDFTEGLVTSADGTPRYRHPGSPGHTEGLHWLKQAAEAPGWTVSTQTFTGADFQALETKDDALTHWSSSCSQEDAKEVPNFQFTNVIMRYNHPEVDDEVLLGAHWESKEDASDGGHALGANDGASGVGVLLAMARTWTPPGDVTIVFFDGEDGFEDCHPLAGSLYYARTMTDAPDAMILLDMVGDPNASFPLEGNSKQSAPRLQAMLWARGEAALPKQFTTVEKDVYDDHIPFIQEGVPSVDLIDYADGFPPYWHTSRDTMDNLDRGFMNQIQRVVEGTLEDWFQAQKA